MLSIIENLEQGQDYEYKLFENTSIFNRDLLDRYLTICDYEYDSGGVSTACEHDDDVFRLDLTDYSFKVDGKKAEYLKLSGTFQHIYVLDVDNIVFADAGIDTA